MFYPYFLYFSAHLGIQPFALEYLDNFRNRNVNGKRLAVMDMSDINDLVGGNLSHKLAIFKSINNLLQMVKFLFYVKLSCFFFIKK